MFTRIAHHRSLFTTVTTTFTATTATYYALNSRPHIAYAQTSLSKETIEAIEPAHLDIKQYYATINSPHAPGVPYIPPLPSDYDLVQVQILHRHGARTPMTDPVDNKASWQQIWGQCNTQDHQSMPCGRGQLTPLGEKQLLDLGLCLRQYLINEHKFLPAGYHPTLYPHLIYSRSTDLFRTRISAARMLEGLYQHLTPADIVNLMIVRSHDQENLFPNHKGCDKLRQIYSIASKQYMQKYAPNTDPDRQQLAKVLETAYKKPFSSTATWIQVSDELRSREIAGHSLPPPITYQHAELANMYAGVMMSYIIRGGHEHTGAEPAEQDFFDVDHGPVETEALTLGIGTVVKELSNNMKYAVKYHNTDPHMTRFYQYSGHDTTMIPIAEAFGQGYLFGRSWPPFASHIMLELIKKKDSASNQSISTKPVSKSKENAEQLLQQRADKQRAQDQHTAHDASELVESAESFPSNNIQLVDKHIIEEQEARAQKHLHDIGDTADNYYVRVMINYGRVNKIIPYRTFQRQLARYAIDEDEWQHRCKPQTALPVPKTFDW